MTCHDAHPFTQINMRPWRVNRGDKDIPNVAMHKGKNRYYVSGVVWSFGRESQTLQLLRQHKSFKGERANDISPTHLLFGEVQQSGQ